MAKHAVDQMNSPNDVDEAITVVTNLFNTMSKMMSELNEIYQKTCQEVCQKNSHNANGFSRRNLHPDLLTVGGSGFE